jgi:hypothetical protein
VPAAAAWLLAVACLALAAVGFTSGSAHGPAAQGYPGVAAAFFFVLLARVSVVPAPTVARLGSWPLSLGGAALCLGVVLGASTLVLRGWSGSALPLAVLGSPLVAVAALRLSTGAGRPRALQATAVALLVLAAAGTLELVRVWPTLRLTP